MDPDQNKDPNYQPAFNHPDYWNNTASGQASSENSNPTPSVSQPSTPFTPSASTAESSASASSILEPKPVSNSYTPPTPKPSGSSNGLMIVMIVLVVVLLGAVGLFAFQNYQLRQQMNPGVVVSPTPTLQTSATPDPTATWKTYINTKYQYWFKYPQDFVFTNASDASTSASISLEPSSYSEKSSLELQSLPILESSILNYIPKSATLSGALALFKGPGISNIQGTTTITLNGNQAIQFYSTNTQAGSGKPDINTLVKTQSGNFLLISLSNYQADPTMLQNYNEILSTYGLPPSPLPSASPSASPISNTCGTGWKLFDNKVVQFCYPDTLKETSASTASAIVMDDTTQTLKVTQNFQGGWGGSPCLFIDKTTVSGYASKRLSWKKENADGTCQNVYTSFAEMVNEGNFTFPFPYAVELTSKKTPYPDNTGFLTIEKSFKVIGTGTQSQ